MTPERSKANEELEFMPVFCTAEIPHEILNAFLKASYEGRTDAENFAPALLSTRDIASIVTPSQTGAPTSFISPFLGSTPEQCYAFFREAIAPLVSEVSGPWPAHTFVVLDARTAADGATCLVCSDVPDYLERERVVLKPVRTQFAHALLEGMCYETFVRCPSESGAGALGAGDVVTDDNLTDYQALSIAPPPLSAADKRQTVSYGLINESIKPGRRWWDRYREE